MWTPIGSMFSIEQMMTTLSFLSRITSSSNSFQPMTRLLDQHFGDRRGIEPALDDRFKFFDVVGDAAAGAAEGEGGADDQRQADDLPAPCGHRPCCGRRRERGTFRPILIIRSLKTWRSSPRKIASRLAPIILHVVLREDALVEAGHAGVQAGLAAERRQQRVDRMCRLRLRGSESSRPLRA